MQTFIAVALSVLLVGISQAAHAAKTDTKAARAECFRKAQEAASSVGFSANVGDRNAMGTNAYRQCCYKAGIRP